MGIKEKRLLKALKYLESKEVNIYSKADIYYKRAIYIASGVDIEVLEIVEKERDKH